MNGLMVGNMRVTGGIISCMVRVFILGRTVENSTASTKTIRKTEKDHFIGQTVENTMEAGKMADSMGKVYLNQLKEFRRKASGKMVSE